MKSGCTLILTEARLVNKCLLDSTLSLVTLDGLNCSDPLDQTPLRNGRLLLEPVVEKPNSLVSLTMALARPTCSNSTYALELWLLSLSFLDAWTRRLPTTTLLPPKMTSLATFSAVPTKRPEITTS